MTLRSLAASLALMCLPFLVSGQENMKSRSYRGKKAKPVELPTWAATHNYTGEQYAYFPDYYTFYTPVRGYVYYKNGTWETNTNAPDYMMNADLSQARVQMLNESPNAQPEIRYRTYRDMYPAQTTGGMVPVPDIR